jgi:hypothetical protein
LIEMVVDELVQLESEEAFATITSLLIADVDKAKLAALFSDCADAANKSGNRENERMFLLAELVTSGTFPTNANVEEIRSRANMMLALHEQQKLAPKIVESAPKVESAAPDAKSSAESAAVVPEPEVKASESPVTAAPEVTLEESAAAPAAPSAEAVAEPPAATAEVVQS